jgi:hypothetical protein
VLKTNVSKTRKAKKPTKRGGHFGRFLSGPDEAISLSTRGSGSGFLCGDSDALMENDFEVAVP